MDKILVTTDLSANSRSAIRFAIQLAKQTRSELIFYFVAEVTKPTSWSDLHYKRYLNETTDRYLPKLKKFVAASSKSRLSNAEYQVGLGLNVPEMIISTAKKNKATFICMSTRGAGKVKKLFGTNASAVISNSPTPVIVVPQRYTAAALTNIFFACDFAALKKEMNAVQNFALKLKADINVFHYDYLLDVPENLRKLETKAEKFRSARVHFHFRKLHIENSLSEHLADEVKKQKPSLVVLFTKQDRNWLDRLLLPSEAAEISFHPTVPLLTFKKK